MTADDLFAILQDVFPDGRRATFPDVATVMQRVKYALDAEGIPTAQQRRYVTTVLKLETILMDKASAEAEPDEGIMDEAAARERVAHWLAVFWPDPEAG